MAKNDDCFAVEPINGMGREGQPQPEVQMKSLLTRTLVQQYNNIAFGKMGKTRSNKRQNREPKRSYARISLKRRKMLINMVFKEGFSIARAIKKLSLKLTTARFILQKYKDTGTFPMKQFKKNVRMMRDLEDSPPQPHPHLKLEEASSPAQVKTEPEETPPQPQHLQDHPPLYWYYYLPYSP